MSSRTITYLIVAVIAGFIILMGMNIAGTFGLLPAKYIAPDDVKGVAIEHDGKMYTLNFEQQKKVLDILNRTIVVTGEEAKKINPTLPVDVSKIVIYRFKGDDIDVKPVGYVGNDSKNPIDRIMTMVFSVPAWNKKSYLEESFPNEMMHVLSTTFDKEPPKEKVTDTNAQRTPTP